MNDKFILFKLYIQFNGQIIIKNPMLSKWDSGWELSLLMSLKFLRTYIISALHIKNADMKKWYFWVYLYKGKKH